MFDVVVFGGGVVGCAVLNSVVMHGANACLIEKQSDVASYGATKANSGIVHAGYDALSGTNKAKFNVIGSKMMPSLCKRLKISFKKIGSLVIGKNKAKLNELLKRGKANGVANLKILTSEEVKKLVPNLNGEYIALEAKDAGIVSPYMLAIALCEEAVINGANLETKFETKKIEWDNKLKIFKIFSNNKIIETKKIINCAGAGYNEIAKFLKTEQKELKFTKGQYYVLDKSNFVRHIIFPLPSALGKGILTTPTVDGNIMFGPTAEPTEKNETATSADGLEKIKQEISTRFINAPFNLSIREYSGVRVACRDDFVVEKSIANPNVINICGINSPGLTSAPAIGEYVAVELMGLSPKCKKMISREGYAVKNKGKIICRCEQIGENEILKAIQSPLKPKTVDGIKRRVRAGMGRCQGGFCMLKICQMIAEQNKISLCEVEKDNCGSKIMLE